MRRPYVKTSNGTNIHTGRQADRHRNKQTDRKTQKRDRPSVIHSESHIDRNIPTLTKKKYIYIYIYYIYI